MGRITTNCGQNPSRYLGFSKQEQKVVHREDARIELQDVGGDVEIIPGE